MELKFTVERFAREGTQAYACGSYHQDESSKVGVSIGFSGSCECPHCGHPRMISGVILELSPEKAIEGKTTELGQPLLEYVVEMVVALAEEYAKELEDRLKNSHGPWETIIGCQAIRKFKIEPYDGGPCDRCGTHWSVSVFDRVEMVKQLRDWVQSDIGLLGPKPEGKPVSPFGVELAVIVDDRGYGIVPDWYERRGPSSPRLQEMEEGLRKLLEENEETNAE